MNKTQLHQICRICSISKTNDNMRCLFDDGPDNLLKEIEFCTGVMFEQQDKYPTHICSTCWVNLQIASSFKKLCKSADDTFSKLKLHRFVNKDVVKAEFEISPSVSTDDGECETLRKSSKRQTYKGKIEKGQQINDLISQIRQKPKRKRKYKKEDDTRCWVCETCGNFYPSKGKLNYHSKCHQPPELCCDDCDYATNYRPDLIKHVRVHLDIKSYKCGFCPQRFRTSSALCDHKRTYHEVVIKKYKCPHCAKMFRRQYECKMHIETHNPVKNFICEICEAKFVRFSNWKRHLLTLHEIVVPNKKPGRKITYAENTEEAKRDLVFS